MSGSEGAFDEVRNFLGVQFGSLAYDPASKVFRVRMTLDGPRQPKKLENYLQKLVGTGVLLLLGGPSAKELDCWHDRLIEAWSVGLPGVTGIRVLPGEGLIIVTAQGPEHVSCLLGEITSLLGEHATFVRLEISNRHEIQLLRDPHT